jgi:hypothetical protein
VVVHWAGFTKGYQGKRLDNTSLRDEPYAFVLGGHEVGGGREGRRKEGFRITSRRPSSSSSSSGNTCAVCVCS